MSGTPAKKATPSLADRLKEKEETKTQETSDKKYGNPLDVSNTKPDNKDNPRPGNGVDYETPTHEDENGEVVPVMGERPISSGTDNSNSTEYVTTESGVLVDKTKFDTRGNGVTDNYPVGYLEEMPANASPYVHSSENATTRHHVAETVYAIPADVDDKGLGLNVEGVTFVNPKTGESFENEQDVTDNENDDVAPNAGSTN